MTSAFDAAINDMLADLRRQYEGMIRLQDNVSEVTGTATSPRQQLSVTVDCQGAPVDLRFHGNGYRKMAPEELASAIIETIHQAQQAARHALWERVGDVGVPGADLAALANGTLDWRAAFGDTFSLPQPLVDLLGAAPVTLRHTADEPASSGTSTQDGPPRRPVDRTS